ncbi:NADH dehydrogenase subunit N [Neisseria gonorrhoeae]|uniref:NADH dehydrogenase subunit N n=1 Tax=Neisseria gonorrhoeae TaxID=485 RepID=A0A379B0Y7_NEIGO|nr:NADH dehydrogenase subunit N [Neisseria gonorrhoeae]
MNWSDLNLMPALPEVALLSLLVLLLPADLWASDDKCRWTHYGALATVAVTAAVQLAVWEQGSTSSFNGMYIADGMSRLAKMVLYALTFVLFVYAKPYNQVRGISKASFTPCRCLPSWA